MKTKKVRFLVGIVLVALTVILITLVLKQLIPTQTTSDEPQPVALSDISKKPPAFTFGVFPYLSPTRLEEVYAPIAADFSRSLDRDIRFRTSSTFEVFLGRLEDELYDIALIQPFHYVQVSNQTTYIPMARMEEPLTAVIMVLQDSPWQELLDLSGQTIAFPPPGAAVSILGKETLRQAGLDPEREITLQYFKSHDACLQQLLATAAAACVTNSIPVDNFETGMGIKLWLLAESTAIPHILFVVHSRVSTADADLIKETILSWPESEAGQQLLRNAGFRSYAFVSALDSDYDIVYDYWHGINE